jgi:single-strand DNA-binding protein
VAYSRFFKQGEEAQKEVSNFDASCWTRLAEVCGEYLKKGRGVRVVGRLKHDR